MLTCVVTFCILNLSLSLTLCFLFIFRGFKALKQTVKLYYKLGKYKEMMEAYRDMLTYIKSAVTRNYSEKCINNIMDFISGSASQNFGLLQEFYQTTLKALEEAKNEVRNLFIWTLETLFCLFCEKDSPVLFSAETLVQDKSKVVQNMVWHWRIWADEQGTFMNAN